MNAYMNQLNNWMYKYKLCDTMNQQIEWDECMITCQNEWMNG